MMFRLVANIRLHLGQQGRAYAEGSISVLPFKFQTILPEPARRIGLQFLHDLSQGQRSRQPNQQMDMVRSSARSQNLESQVVRNADQVSVKSLLQFGRNQTTALLGAEDAMHEVGSMCVRHEGGVP